MNSETRTILAPFVRGLTFDGHACAMVTQDGPDPDPGSPGVFYLEALPSAELSTGATATIPIGPALARRLSESYRKFVTREGDRPSACVLHFDDGSSFSCRIGTTVDEARSGSAGGTSAGRRAAGAGDREKGTGGEPSPAQLFSDRASVVAGRVAVVTGGAQGFGEGIVRSLAAGGSVVCIVDLNLEGARALAGELNRFYGRTTALAFGGNVTDEQSVQELVGLIVDAVGGIDLLVSNAGVLKAGSVTEMPLEDFSFVTSVNYVGFFICTKFISPIMALQNAGSGGRSHSDIIQINSKSGLEGSNRNAAYAGSKFGSLGLVQSFALELVTHNIKVNAVCPGNFFEGPLWSDPDRGLFVQYLRAGKVPGAQSIADVKRYYEEKVPMGRGCRPEDVVRSICYIVEQVYETGQAVPVTGGQVMLN